MKHFLSAAAVALAVVAANQSAAQDRSFTLSLYYAVESNNLPVAQLLIDNGADVNAKNGDGRTPLRIAQGYGNFSMAELLIENGAY